MGSRRQALNDWLEEGAGLAAFSLSPASDDASFRRYYRVTLENGDTRIVMDAPPEHEECGPFVDLARRFARLGLHVPAIHAVDLERGFILLEDLGSIHYLDVLDNQRADRLYGDALGALIILQSVGPTSGLPLYDESLLRQEMSLFDDWLLRHHLKLELGESELLLLHQCADRLVDNALQQPQVCVHRDYHSRNLLLTETTPSPGIIDFQDAVVGPVTYDLVSLLKDCYVAWPIEQVHEWVLGYHQLAQQSGVIHSVSETTFLRWFDLMGVQRHLKASGIFARLNHRDGKPGYLQDIPRTLEYIVEVADRYPEMSELGQFIQRRVMPHL